MTSFIAQAQSAQDGFDPGVNGTVWALAVQPDGKILVGGRFTLLGGGGSGTSSRSNIGRLNPDGSLDTSFTAATNGRVNTIALQTDGKILVGGEFTEMGSNSNALTSRNFIGRLNPDGSLDDNFDPGANYFVRALAVQQDGKILVAGSFYALGGGAAGLTPRKFIGRLNGDGSMDDTFDPGANAEIYALSLQANGQIMVGGAFSALGGGRGTTARHFLGRLDADGSVDLTFDPGANNPVWALAVQTDGKILAGGNFTTLGGGETGTIFRSHVGRLQPDGLIDETFDPGASAIIYDIRIQADGRILLGGAFARLGGGSDGVNTRNFIGRLNIDGSLDADFDPGTNSIVYAIRPQADGKILVAGAFATLGGGVVGTSPRNRIGRLYADGSLDDNFGLGADDIVRTIALQGDGRILAGGSFSKLGSGGTGAIDRSRIARFHPDGDLDAGFNPGANNQVSALAVQSDGKILVGGSFSRLGGGGVGAFTRYRLGRLNPDGSLDSSFDPGANGEITALAVQPDGKIIVAGSFTTLGGGGTGSTPRNYIGRLNADGSIDPGFDPGANGPILALAVQADGKILVGGSFTTLGGGGTGTGSRKRIGRLLASGALDTGFDPGADAEVDTLAAQPDGRILVGGRFSGLGSGSGATPRRHIGRLQADGSVDNAFDPGADDTIWTISLQIDGKILLGGAFTTLGGGGTGTVSRSHIGRLNADGSVDPGFDPGADGLVLSLALQTDGKPLVGGAFRALGGGGFGTSPRNGLGRLTTAGAAYQMLQADTAGSKITWNRTGTGPEIERAWFEYSADGAVFSLLGSATRITGGWQLNGLSLPMAQTIFIRARGSYASGADNGSGSIAESIIATSSILAIFAQVAAGGAYETVLTGINTGQVYANVLLTLRKSDGTPLQTPAGSVAEPELLTIPPMGTVTLPISRSGDTVSGYALLSSTLQVEGTALFKSMHNNLILSEAGVGLSKPTHNFTVYIDNTANAASGYAIANIGNATATLELVLRDAVGNERDHASISLAAGRHLAEFAFQRFSAAAPAGFEGSIECTSDQTIAAVALRYDNMNLNALSQVFSTIPVLVNESAPTMIFPQVADGAGYRTNFILVNPGDTAVVARIEFFDDTGNPLFLPINGSAWDSYPINLSPRGVARVFTDGTSADLKVGWARVRSLVPILGSSIFQIRSGDRIISEAGVSSSPLTRHFTTYVESLGSTWSGLAVCNPNDSEVTLTLNLRLPDGEIYAVATDVVPAGGHLSKFFTFPTNPSWFPNAAGFEGTLEVTATQPVSAVALRYDNPQHDVFATLPVVILR